MKTNTPVDLSVVILNYNTSRVTGECLRTVMASRMGTYHMEVIVCDNGSTDGSVDMIRNDFPAVRLIENGKNLGFAAGNNPGIKSARGRYIVLLNSDTEVPPDAFSAMVAFMDAHPDAGAATSKLILPDGTMDPACHRGFPTPWAAFTYITKLERLFPRHRLFGQYHQGYKDLSAAHEVDCISGAFFLVRRKVLEDVGLLDEEYFMYGEDIDWAYRIRKHGWKILFNPDVSVLHKKKQSGRSHGDVRRKVETEIYFHTYNRLFYRKNYAKHYGAVMTLAVEMFYAVRLFFLTHFGR